MKTLFPPYAHPPPSWPWTPTPGSSRTGPAHAARRTRSLGRVDLDWGGRSLADVLADVDAWRADGVEGLFLDRAPAGSGGVGPVALTVRLAARRGLHRVVLNPGVPTDPLYRDLGVRICTFDGPVVGLPGLGRRRRQRPATATSCTACRTALLTAARRLMGRRGAGFGLATDASPPRLSADGCARGRGWQRGQLKEERFMNCSRRIGVPQRWQGSPSRPYAFSDRSK